MPWRSVPLGGAARKTKRKRHRNSPHSVKASPSANVDSESIVIVVGHPEYYPRVWILYPSLHEVFRAPFNGEAWMALELCAGSTERCTAASVQYPPAWGIGELVKEKEGQGR